MSALARSPEWHEERRRGIGASDVPAIAGISGFASPIDVWEQKTGRVEPNAENAMTRWGTLLEPVIADEFAVKTGLKVRRIARAVRYRDWPILFAHLDRQVVGGGILECKSSMTTRGWGESGTSEVPDHVALQVQAQLACADAEVAHVAALIGYRDFRTYLIARDRPLFEDDVLPLLKEFWTLVETDTPPEADGSESFGSYLRRRFPTDSGDERVATPEETLIASDFAATKAMRIAAEIKEEELAQRLMASMGESSKLTGPGWHVTWRQSKPRTVTDWKSIADGFLRQADDDVASALFSMHTESKPGARPFRFVVNEGVEE